MGSQPRGISASRGAAILGLSKYRSPVDIWLEIMEEREPGFCEQNGYETPAPVDPWNMEDKSVAPLRWGLAMEGVICDYFGITEDQERFYSENGIITCHIDGRDADGNLHENKTTNIMAFNRNWGVPGTDQIPADYQVQVQHQMMLTGDKRIFVNVLVFPKMQAELEDVGWEFDNGEVHRAKTISSQDLIQSLDTLGFLQRYEVAADKKLQDMMRERYTKFWEENVLAKVPPIARDFDDLKKIIPAPTGEIEADERIRELWNEYSEIDAELQSATKRQKTIKDAMSEYIAKSELKEGPDRQKIRIMAGSKTVATYSVSESGRKSFRVNTIKGV